MAERKIQWAPRDENVLIGADIDRIDGYEKATGRAKFSADINTKGTLYARLLTCKHAHAKITRLNVEPAKKIEGVRAVHIFNGEGKELFWDGMLVAAVAADRPELAEDGIRAIEIEYEVLEHFVDEEDLKAAQEAERDRPRSPKKSDVKGDVEGALKKAKAVHKGYYGIHTISHMCMEPHGSHCEWDGDNLNAHLSTQNVSGTGGQFAKNLGIEAGNVSLTCDYIGGGFGSKFAVDEWDAACAKMARETGRPVRLMLDRATELKIPGNRPSGFADVTIAGDENGRVVAWDSHHWGTDGISGGTLRLTGMPYVFDFENRSRRVTGIVTNCGPNRAWRAPHHPQLCSITDTAMDDLAAKLGMDSYDLFMNNLDQVTNDKSEVYADQMKIGAKLIDWKGKWHAHGKNAGAGSVKRGLGMALHMWGGGANASSCTLKIHPDGSIESSQGSQDLGTGTRTVIAITVAETFGLPVSAVKVNLGSNKYPKAGGSGGSTTVGGVCGPNRRAAQRALWKIFDLVAKKYGVHADSLRAKGGRILSGPKAVCTWKQACSLVGPMALEVQAEREKDGLTSVGVAGVQMADVSVDTETGVIHVNKFVCVQDCGLIVDAKTARSQVLGALTMGIAYATTEERVMDVRSGRYINADLENYKLPRIGDIGELVAEMYQPDREYERGIVGLGEPPVISSGAAISNAVANATGVRVPVLPLTPKRVLDALKGGQA